jgi:hypothetical protein
MYDNYSPQNSSTVDEVLMRSRVGIWLFGNACWLFEIHDRGFAAFGSGHPSAIALLQLATVIVCFIGWLFLKPNGNWLERKKR